MGTSRSEIKGWVTEAKKDGCSHLIVVCDTYDHEDYPVYVKPGNIKTEITNHTGNMQRIMEVYAPHLDLEKQLNEHRAFHPEEKTE